MIEKLFLSEPSLVQWNFTGVFINMLCAVGVRGCLLNGQASRGLLVCEAAAFLTF